MDAGVAIVAGPPGPSGVLADVVNSTGPIGKFVSYYYEDTTAVRTVIAAEDWGGHTLLVARNETTGAVVRLPWQRLTIQYTQANCIGTPYVYSTEATRSWAMQSNGWYLPQGAVQNLSLYSERINGGGCLNFTIIDAYDVVPLASLPQPPSRTGPLWIELR